MRIGCRELESSVLTTCDRTAISGEENDINGAYRIASELASMCMIVMSKSAANRKRSTDGGSGVRERIVLICKDPKKRK